jgi:hypothetical protein
LEQLRAYTGAYRSDEIDSVYRIELEDGALTLKRLKVKPDKCNRPSRITFGD